MFEQATFNAWKNKKHNKIEMLETVIEWLKDKIDLRNIEVYNHDHIMSIRESLFQDKVLERPPVKIGRKNNPDRFEVLKDYTLIVSAIKKLRSKK